MDKSGSPVKTTCPYCGVGCGVIATRRKDVVDVRGDASHPANRGKLCVKGSALGETVGLEDRLLYPQVRGARVSWSEAIATVAGEFRRCIERYGPESVAFYVSGQLLTEDYYVANKLMKGYIGAANIDTNSRLCMASAVAGHKRAFGEDVVPVTYEDLDVADLIVLVGSNTAWCHPIILQRILAAREKRPVKIVAIDPRRTATTQIADLHLSLAPGTDVHLFNGLLVWLAEQGHLDQAYIDAHTSGFDAALQAARDGGGSLEATARACRIEAAQLRAFFELFAATPAALTMFSQGVNQSSAGTDKVNAIINCHLATGRIGKPGAGPFSVTGQPNAMGGREVGGFANTLAAHIDIENNAGRDAVQRFWACPTMPRRQGPKAVEMFDRLHDERIKAIWVMATNPVVSLPDADKVKAALQNCEFVVVSDVVANADTATLAHVLLPALAWGEKDGMVTNSDRTMSRQRPFLPAPGEARADWRIVCDVARAMEYSGFDFVSPHEIFREHARLTGVANEGTRALDLTAWSDITAAEYKNWQPAAWPMGGASREGMRGPMFADGKFLHADGRARFIALTPRGPEHATGEEFPLVLNTGRVRDHWHTMTRTGKSARLSSHVAEPFIEVSVADALKFAVRAGELARVRSAWGSMVVRVRTDGEVPAGVAFAPIHWNDAYASDARVGALTNPVVDPISGEPELKHTPVSIEPFIADWYGVIFTRAAIATPDVAWWARIQGASFTRYEIVGRSRLDWKALARQMLAVPESAEVDWIEYSDPARGLYRGAWIVDEKLQACIYIDGRPTLPDRGWLASLFGTSKLTAPLRASLLAARALEGSDQGAMVCSCFGVGRNAIAACARQLGAAATAAEIGKRLKCGTNCGSCVPEIQVIIGESRKRTANA